MRVSFKVALAVLLLVGIASGQQRPRRGGPPPRNTALIERLNRMTPEQRQRALDKLPPERRARVEKRLENFKALPPDVKAKLREDYEEFQKLPPERQNAIRRAFRQLNELPDDRKPVVRRELNRLRKMSAEDRSATMEADRFRTRFSEPERQLLFDLTNR